MILLVIIYLAFISLGLPDSILGSAWPAIQTSFGVAIDAAGYVSFILVSSTIVSSFMSGHVIKRFGTGKVTFISCLMTGLSLLGFSYAPSYVWLLLLAVPLGLGGGSVDTALNNYVATHYKASHMNWLHAFWGVGATIGPMIMSVYVTTSWQSGYRTISFMQLFLALVLFLTLFLWPKDRKAHEEASSKKKNIFNVKGVKFALMVFLFYCMVEFSTGLWGASFLVKIKNISPEIAARYVAMYYGGITVGRVLSGILTYRLSNKQLILGGTCLAFVGIIILMVSNGHVLMFGLIVLGLGLAPIFPAMIHETPNHFGKDISQIVIGYQIGFAGIGSAFLPPMIGLLVRVTSLSVFPVVLLLGMIMVFLSALRVLNIKA